MSTFFIYLFGTMALLGGLGTILSRHPISSALSLVTTFLALASLYALLDAHLIAAIQIIVYAGAIMVLVIYTILLMDIQDEDLRGGLTMTGLAGLVLGIGWVVALWNRVDRVALPEAAALPEGFGGVRAVARELFNTHVYTFEMVSILLLSAIVGALVLALRGQKAVESEEGRS